MEMTCTYRGNREESLIAYLYDAAEPGERLAFEAHLAGCLVCRQELSELGLVRTELAKWAPPEPSAGWLSDRAGYAAAPPVQKGWAASMREMPAWAQLAAAMLVLGVSAGAANLRVNYDEHGLTVQTGWMGSTASDRAVGLASPTPTPTANADPAPWRVELASLEQQLRDELKPAQQPPARERDVDATAVLRQVRALIDESEKKQQRELALRIAENANVRAAELRNIDRNFNAIQVRTGADMQRLYLQQQELAKRVALVR